MMAAASREGSPILVVRKYEITNARESVGTNKQKHNHANKPNLTRMIFIALGL